MMKYETHFNRTFIHDVDSIIKIIKIFHPDIPDFILQVEVQGRFNTGGISRSNAIRVKQGNYDWVTLEGKIKDYGQVAIGIDNCHNSTLFGPKITRDHMRKAIEKGDVTFKVWRFAHDIGSKNDPILVMNPIDRILTPFPDLTEEEKAIEIIKKAGHRLQSVDEWYKLYYQD